MLTKQEFIDMLADEMRVCQHIATKIDPKQLDFRFSEGQRTTLELMRYLSYCGSGTIAAIVGDDWSVFGPLSEAASTMSFEEFPARMDDQIAKIRADLADVPEADFTERRVTMPWGSESSLGAALVGTALQFLVAYRLQLFTHAKTMGASDLSTYDAWMGIDKPAE